MGTTTLLAATIKSMTQNNQVQTSFIRDHHKEDTMCSESCQGVIMQYQSSKGRAVASAHQIKKGGIETSSLAIRCKTKEELIIWDLTTQFQRAIGSL